VAMRSAVRRGAFLAMPFCAMQREVSPFIGWLCWF
jgi:hypothetical protein